MLIKPDDICCILKMAIVENAIDLMDTDRTLDLGKAIRREVQQLLPREDFGVFR